MPPEKLEAEGVAKAMVAPFQAAQFLFCKIAEH